jgi:hypothetical protein
MSDEHLGAPDGMEPRETDRSRLARRVLAWGLTIGALLAVLGAFVGYRATGTFLGAMAGVFTVAALSSVAQFALVVVGAVKGLRSRD